MSKRPDKTLIITIAAASVIVAAALVYAGNQLAGRPDEARVIALINERLEQQPQTSTSSTPAETTRTSAKPGEMSDKEFDARVERGIVAFIDKQRRNEQERPAQLAKNVPAPNKADHVYGNPNAPITLIEYSDFECPYCKTFHPTAKRLVDSSNGNVNWVYRHFPLHFHNPGAQKQAEASECAAELGGNDAFWKYADTLYARTKAGGRGFPLENLAPLAVEIGLDKAAFEKCLNSGKYARRVEQHLAEAEKAGVNGTPGNILYSNKTRKAVPLHGAQPYENFRAALDSLSK